MKISTSIVHRYKKELGLPNVGQKQKWTPEVIDKLRTDAKSKTRNELAKKYKTSAAQISTIARRYDIVLIDSKVIWTKELDEKLVELLDLELSIAEISKKMNIKANLIRQKINELNLTDKKPKNPNYIWTEEEVNKLKELSLEKTSSQIAQILGKTEKQICDKAKKMGVSINKDNNYLWTKEEISKLIDIHDKYELHQIAQMLSRSEAAIRQKAKELDLTIKCKKRSRWSKEEETKLIDYLNDYTVNEIAQFLNRSTSSITSKLNYMGLSAQKSSSAWTEEEIKKLIDLVENYDVYEISKIMNRTYGSICNKLYKLGIKPKIKNNKSWTEEETKTMLELLEQYSSFEVANMLGRSEEVVMTRAKKAGYDINFKHRRWTVEEEIMLSDMWGNEPIEKISKKLNRTESAIIGRVHILELGSQISNNYEGITIPEISDMFKVDRNTILSSWVALGLKLDYRKRSNNSIYSFVRISNLYDFLEKNQNIWDSRLLEKNILGVEPLWLQEKRKRDKEISSDVFRLDNLSKQQLINEGKYFLNIDNASDIVYKDEEDFELQQLTDEVSPKLVKNKK